MRTLILAALVSCTLASAAPMVRPPNIAIMKATCGTPEGSTEEVCTLPRAQLEALVRSNNAASARARELTARCPVLQEI